MGTVQTTKAESHIPWMRVHIAAAVQASLLAQQRPQSQSPQPGQRAAAPQQTAATLAPSPLGQPPPAVRLLNIYFL